MNSNSSTEADIPLAEVNRVEDVASDRSHHSEYQDTSRSSSRPEFSLPPVDGGKDAWLCLVGCFFIEALVWGEFVSSRFFQEYIFFLYSPKYIVSLPNNVRA